MPGQCDVIEKPKVFKPLEMDNGIFGAGFQEFRLRMLLRQDEDE
jgi:hypothetical protein